MTEKEFLMKLNVFKFELELIIENLQSQEHSKIADLADTLRNIGERMREVAKIVKKEAKDE